ncbi:MAG: aldehyde dehydrogenase family protein [Gammaproteobacteria bacterium]
MPDPKRLLIDGRWQPSIGGQHYPIFDPSTGQHIADAADAVHGDIDCAVRAARRAFDDGPWPRMSTLERGKILWRIGDRILEHADQLAELEALNAGRPISIARMADVPLAAEFFQTVAGGGSKSSLSGIADAGLFSDTSAGQRITRLEPAGVIAQIVAVDLPMLLAAWKLAPALAAGCTVVIKIATEAPFSAIRLAEIMQEAGIPDGVVNLITSARLETVVHLAGHRDIDRVEFAGEHAMAVRVSAAAARCLHPCRAEIAGLRPEIICADADLDEACSGAANALFLSPDQGYFSGAELLVEATVCEQVAARIENIVASIKIGPGRDPSVQIGPAISAVQKARIDDYRARARVLKLTLLDGGAVPCDGYFVAPTVIVGRGAARRRAIGRVPNSIVWLSRFERGELTKELARRNGPPFSSMGFWTGDKHAAIAIANRFRAATVRLNFTPGNRFRDLCDFYSQYRFERGLPGLRADAHSQLRTLVVGA